VYKPVDVYVGGEFKTCISKVPMFSKWRQNILSLTLILSRKCLLYFKVLQNHSYLVKILSERQTALVRMRRELGVLSGSKLFAYVAIGRIGVKKRHKRAQSVFRSELGAFTYPVMTLNMYVKFQRNNMLSFWGKSLYAKVEPNVLSPEGSQFSQNAIQSYGTYRKRSIMTLIKYFKCQSNNIHIVWKKALHAQKPWIKKIIRCLTKLTTQTLTSMPGWLYIK